MKAIIYLIVYGSYIIWLLRSAKKSHELKDKTLKEIRILLEESGWPDEEIDKRMLDYTEMVKKI